MKYLSDSQQQSCKVCGRKDKFDFHITNKIWEAVVPPIFQTKVVCLACFDAFAREKNIQYADAIEVLYFAGEKAVVTFSVRSATSLD